MHEYIPTADAAVKWGVSQRRVNALCQQDRIPGAIKIGRDWSIPANAEKPKDPRYDNKDNSTNKTTPPPAQSGPHVEDYSDKDKLSKPFKALIGNQALFYQLLESHPTPLQVFSPDGTCIFINRVFAEMTGDIGRNVVGKYNLKEDPVCLEIMGQELMDRMFCGEVCSLSGFPVPIQDTFDKGFIDKKPWEAATMDIFSLPMWDGDIFVCTISFFTVKMIYEGRADISKAQEYIETHWFEDFDLDKAAQSINLSRHHFTRVFKEISGDTPVRYYKKIKIKKIQEKLFDGNLNVEQAFAACGVEYHGAYLRLFKEFTGKTPTEFRKYNNIK